MNQKRYPNVAQESPMQYYDENDKQLPDSENPLLND